MAAENVAVAETQAKSKTPVNVVMFTGRTSGWQACAASVEEHVVRPLEALTGAPVLLFASIHRNEDGGMDESNQQFLDRHRPLAHHVRCYAPPDATHPTITARYPGSMASHRCASMFYHMHSAFQLAAAHLEQHADLEPVYVVRLRPDMRFTRAWELPAAAPEADMVYIPETHEIDRHTYYADWLCDHAAAGGWETMRSYCCGVYEKMYKAFVPIYLPESTLMAHVVKEGGRRWAWTPCDYALSPPPTRYRGDCYPDDFWPR